nr:FAD binding domain-containing protein [Seohaeicola saemankumensis]
MPAYFRPDNLNEALALLAEEPVTLAAGCTDLFPATEAKALNGPVLDLTAIDGLRGVVRGSEGWRIGTLTTWSDLCKTDLPAAFDMLKQAAREVGSWQIQNAGTVAGNLCNASPAADGVPPLLALDARVELQSAKGTRVLPLGSFVTGVRKTALQPGEMVTAILIPAAAGAGISRFRKLGARRYLVISIAMVAGRLVVEDGKIGEAAISVGSCSPVAVRLREVENQLLGCRLADVAATVDADMVARALSPIDDVRGDAAYRTTAAVELVRRTLADLAGEAS